MILDFWDSPKQICDIVQGSHHVCICAISLTLLQALFKTYATLVGAMAALATVLQTAAVFLAVCILAARGGAAIQKNQQAAWKVWSCSARAMNMIAHI